MKAIVRDGYGPPDIVRLDDLPMPTPGPDDVLVRVRASSLNAADLDYLYGRPTFARALTGLRGPRQRRLGLDVAGVVEAVGPDVTAFRPGDSVFGDMTSHGSGAFAEYVSAPARAFAPTPPSLTLEQAATIPQSAILAIQGLRGGRPIRPGDRVLVNGASGNVGPFAVQIAKALGAEVTGSCRADKADFVRDLGADEVIDYAQVDVTRAGRRWDRILDVHARYPIADYRRAIAADGTYACLGGTGRGILEALVVGSLISVTSRRRMGLVTWWRPFDRDDIATLTGLVEAGQLRPVIDRTFPLDEAAAALRFLDEGRARGKVVLTVA